MKQKGVKKNLAFSNVCDVQVEQADLAWQQVEPVINRMLKLANSKDYHLPMREEYKSILVLYERVWVQRHTMFIAQKLATEDFVSTHFEWRSHVKAMSDIIRTSREHKELIEDWLNEQKKWRFEQYGKK